MTHQWEWKLKDEIVDTELCAKCGTCVVVCPNDLLDFENHPKLIEECLRKGNGMCYDICPRVSSGGYQIKIRESFKKEFFYGKGDVKGQDGGVVSTFLKYLLKKRKIDGAIVVGDELWKPTSWIIKDPDDIEKSAKSKYTVSTLDALKKASEIGCKEVAVVGLPCQIQGLRKIQYFPYLAKYDGELGKDGKPTSLPKIKYLIGLFCMEKFEHDSFYETLEKHGIDIEKVEKFDIKGNKLLVYLKNEKHEIPLKELDVCSGCKICRDFDSEMADVSVGSVGSPEGYSTIIIRTKKGEEIKNAVKLRKGVDIESIEKLKSLKIRRFKEEIKKRKRKNKKVSFYWTDCYPGVSKRADGTYFIRIRARPGGWYDIDEVEKILKIVKEYDANLKITNRGGFEIHGIAGYDVEDVVLELMKEGLITGSEGPLVRATLACPGKDNCGSGIINTKKLAQKIEDKFKERPSPYKFKIAISGCPNKCVRPQIHDIGVAGVRYPLINEEKCNGCGRCAEVCKVEAIDIRGETSYTNYNLCIGCGKCIDACPNEGREVKDEGYRLYIGGKSGREIVEGIDIGIIDNEDKILELIDAVLNVYSKYAEKPQRERLSAVMERVGKGKFLKEIKNWGNYL
nr:Coenzyme F420 hydrogenase/dehydrogenase, beta subunit C-terminal domain [Methanothermus fervidus]